MDNTPLFKTIKIDSIKAKTGQSFKKYCISKGNKYIISMFFDDKESMGIHIEMIGNTIYNIIWFNHITATRLNFKGFDHIQFRSSIDSIFKRSQMKNEKKYKEISKIFENISKINSTFIKEGVKSKTKEMLSDISELIAKQITY